MKHWPTNFKRDPVAPLVECGDKAISFFARRDLLGKSLDVQELWQLTDAQRILRRQQPSGCWIYAGKKAGQRTQDDYNQLETYRNLGILVEQFGFDRRHPAIEKAANYFFTIQSAEGDFRGIYGTQYSPNYTAGITELLVKSGYENDAHVKRVFQWLLDIRQTDGGWAIPFRTQGYGINVVAQNGNIIEPNSATPFSHLVTGVVLRAFAAHPVHKNSVAARTAGELLLSHLFKKDNYPDRATPEYWLRFSFPFWFTDLISALDSLSLIGFTRKESQIEKGLQWLHDHQRDDGFWELKILKGHDRDVLQLWLSLAICRIFKRFYL